MDALTKAQILWAETGNLQVPDGGDRGTLSKLRQHVAAIASEAENTFSRFEPLPARDDPNHGKEVIDCAVAAEGSTPNALKNLRVIVWPSADGKTLSKHDVGPPAPWDTAAPETLELIGRFKVESRDVSAFSRAVVPGEDARRFVSIVTGTGLPPGTGVYSPRGAPRKVVDPKSAAIAIRLAFATLVLFAVACVWALSVGSLARSSQSNFLASLTFPTTCPTAIDPGKPATLFGAPKEWLLTGGDGGPCLKAWQDSTTAALAAPNRDWWSKLKGWLAEWSVSDAGRAFSLRMPMLLMMTSIVLLALSAGIGVLGRPLGLFIDKRNRMSLTKIQFAVWLVILMGSLATYTLFNVGFWAEDLNRIREGVSYLASTGKQDQKLAEWSARLSALLDFLPGMDTALWGLIGISGATTIISSLVMQPGGLAATGSSGTVVPARRTVVLANADPKEAALADLVYGETEEDHGVVDSTRVQAVVVTGVLAALYLNLVLEGAERIGGLSATEAVNAGKQVFASMPPTGTTFLWLLGISHGTLLGGKLLGAYGGGK